MTVVGIIPARHASVRFPGKPLVDLCGKPMIRWVHEGVSRARSLDAVIVATDDERIRTCVLGFGGRVVMTSADHASGTDRLAEVAAGLEADIVVNVQGDEPLIDPDDVDLVVQSLRDDADAEMATLASRLDEARAFEDPSVVKVVRDTRGRALYFSRAPIPWPRDASAAPDEALRHVGIYAYRRDFLLRFHGWAPTPLERAERLEQLRALEHGTAIRVALTPRLPLGVDIPGDVSRVEARLREAVAHGAGPTEDS